MSPRALVSRSLLSIRNAPTSIGRLISPSWDQTWPPWGSNTIRSPGWSFLKWFMVTKSTKTPPHSWPCTISHLPQTEHSANLDWQRDCAASPITSWNLECLCLCGTGYLSQKYSESWIDTWKIISLIYLFKCIKMRNKQDLLQIWLKAMLSLLLRGGSDALWDRSGCKFSHNGADLWGSSASHATTAWEIASYGDDSATSGTKWRRERHSKSIPARLFESWASWQTLKRFDTCKNVICSRKLPWASQCPSHNMYQSQNPKSFLEDWKQLCRITQLLAIFLQPDASADLFYAAPEPQGLEAVCTLTFKAFSFASTAANRWYAVAVPPAVFRPQKSAVKMQTFKVPELGPDRNESVPFPTASKLSSLLSSSEASSADKSACSMCRKQPRYLSIASTVKERYGSV